MNNQLTIQQLANYFLNKESMTHKKLQKICYYAVAWGWALMNRSIVSDDTFEAWVHGPVAPTLYNLYKKNGWNSIPKFEGTIKVESGLDELLESVWFTYGDKGGNELEALSHAEAPWLEARAGLPSTVNSARPIDSTIMNEFYSGIKSSDF